jgi:hypothetical protein
MKLASWPEDLLWQHYVCAQVAAAAAGLISDEMLALAVHIHEESVVVRAVVARRTDDVVEDLDDICFELDVLLEGHVLISAEIQVGLDPSGRLLPDGANRIYVAKGATERLVGSA